MIGKINLSGFAFWLIVFLANSAFGQMAGYPAPRYPKVPNITSVEQLLPYARFVVSNYGDKTIVMRPGYGIKGGEKVLIRVSDDNDPMVIEAFRRAFVEKNCTVDILLLPTNRLIRDEPTDGTNELKFSRWVTPDPVRVATQMAINDENDKTLDAFIRSRKYDLVIGATTSVGDGREYLSERMHWFTREMLASPATTYPEELVNLLDRKGWEIIRMAKSAHVTSPEGTDISWTWWPGYWQVVEGTHPTVKTIGGGPRSGNAGYVYGPGRSEDPLIPGHLMGVPEGIVIPESDAEGVVAGTMNGSGPFKRMEVYVKNHQVTEVKGDGEYANLFRQVMQKFQDIQYPIYPRKGYGFLVECAIGTLPKVSLPFNTMETVKMRAPFVSKVKTSPSNVNLYRPGPWGEERRRSGMVHWGFGIISAENEKFGLENDAPTYHYHVHAWFITYEATMPDGQKKLVINKGHLTALDDPEVRRVAAKYGNPDELLQEDWIPAIPGVNIPGDYMKDYAQDPYAFFVNEHRKVYAEALERWWNRGKNIYEQ